MACAQRRNGPFNLGNYGIYSSLINGINLIISQYLLPKLYFYLFFLFYVFYFIYFSLLIINFIYPFFLINLYLTLILVIIFSLVSIIMIICLAFSLYSKYSMLGCIRIISQLISFELLFSTIVFIYVYSFNDLSLISY